MQYKTIVLELLKDHPEIHNQLRSTRMLRPTMDLFARGLKTSHERWKDRLSQAKPESDVIQIASEALEIALREMEDYLDSAASPQGGEPLSLDGAMAFIRGRTPPE